MLKYRKVAISELTPGSVLATPIYDERYVKLLDTGIMVDQHFLDRLKERGITEVRVKSAAIQVVAPNEPAPSGISVHPKGDPVHVDRCSRCGAQIALKPPKPDAQASAWLCKKCGAVYFCADDGDGDERLGVSRAEPKPENPFAARVEVKLDAKSPSVPPENVQRLVKSLVTETYTGDDRRRHKRYPVTVPVVAVALGSDFRIVGEPVRMTTADVSLGGAALIHTRFVDAPYLALDFSTAGVELMQVVMKVLRVRNIGPVYQVAGEFISQLSQRP